MQFIDQHAKIHKLEISYTYNIRNSSFLQIKSYFQLAYFGTQFLEFLNILITKIREPVIFETFEILETF